VEAQVREEVEKRTCPLHLYVITPKMTGVFSIAEVVDDSNKRARKTILCLLNQDEDCAFTEGQWRSLDAVARLVQHNGAKVVYNLIDAADWLNRWV
jgi:hypothetical protein